MLGAVHYMSAQDVANAHPEFMRVVNNVPRNSFDGSVYWNHLPENGRRWMLQPDQKKVALAKDRVHKFSKSGTFGAECVFWNAFYV